MSDSNANEVNGRGAMLLQTPFHSRSSALNELNSWENWKGYMVAHEYSDYELEYFSIRSQTGVMDLTPMSKYRITGPDSEAYLNRLVTRDMSKIKVGRVAYTVWCNSDGMVMDDGTIFHLAENDYRLCSYTQCIDWLSWSADGFDVEIVDETKDVAALSVQGPTSCSCLKNMGLTGIENLKSFGIMSFPFEGGELVVSRTGFTGDLGYELWIDPSLAEVLWDKLFAAGKEYLIRPFGLYALNMARIEAGFVQAAVDFVPAEDTVRVGRARTPFELGLDWLIDFKKPFFNGRKALLKEKENGSRYRFVMLDVEDNKPATNSFILNKQGKQIGTVTSAGWCPTAKGNVAFAQIDPKYGQVGEELIAEIYFERELMWTKFLAKSTVIKGPMFDHPRKRTTPPAQF